MLRSSALALSLVAGAAVGPAQDLRVSTPRFYNAALGGWNGSGQHVWDGGAVDPAAPMWTAPAGESVRGSLTAPDGSVWYDIVRTPSHGSQEGDLVHVARDGSERRFGRLWTGGRPSSRSTASMALDERGRLYAVVPSRIRSLAGGRYVVEPAEIARVEPASGAVSTVVTAAELASFVGGVSDGNPFGLHWRRTPTGGTELVFGLDLLGTTSRMDLLGWRPDAGGLRRIRELARLPEGMVRSAFNPPALVAHGDQVYFVTPIVTPFAHSVPPEPARLQRLDLATGARETLAEIPYDPSSSLRGFEGLAVTHGGQLVYGRRHDLGVNAPVRLELFRIDPRRGSHDRLGDVATLPAHSGVPSGERFGLTVFAPSPGGAADIDHDFRLGPLDVELYSLLFAAGHARADLDSDLDVDLDDARVFLRGWFEGR